jgi:ferritin-like metal-binding protein YciE
MKGLLEERNWFKEQEEPADDILSIFDVGAAIKVESYEISAYNSLIELAKQLDLAKAIRLLNQNLKEEQQTKTKLEAISRKLKPDNLGMEEEGEEIEQERPARRSAASSRGKSRSRRAA